MMRSWVHEYNEVSGTEYNEVSGTRMAGTYVWKGDTTYEGLSGAVLTWLRSATSQCNNATSRADDGPERPAKGLEFPGHPVTPGTAGIAATGALGAAQRQFLVRARIAERLFDPFPQHRPLVPSQPGACSLSGRHS